MKTGPAREKAISRINYVKNIFPKSYSCIEIYGNYGQVRLQGTPLTSKDGVCYSVNIPDCLFCANTISKKEVLEILMEGNEDKYAVLKSENRGNIFIFNLDTLPKSGIEFLGIDVRCKTNCRVKIGIKNTKTGKYQMIFEIELNRIEEILPLLNAFKKNPNYEKEYEKFQKDYEELRIPSLKHIVKKKNEQNKKVQAIKTTIENQNKRKNQFVEALLNISTKEKIDFSFAMRHHIEDPILREELTQKHVQIQLTKEG